MKILILNCGSSSIKYQLVDMENNSHELLAIGLVERVGIEGSFLKHRVCGKESVKFDHQVPDHTVGIDIILNILTDKEYGILKDKNEIEAVGHRVVHGGDKFSGSVKITPEVIEMMEQCCDLAPLHNPANLKGIYAISKLLPHVTQCGVFDTAFHQTMPEFVYMYALPYEYYENYKVRRYGFHGTSHRYVSRKACEILGVNYNEQRIITCHLGNGASIAAIKNGKSFDTSMGLTPVEGLIMGTRCGDLDLGAMLFIMEKENLDLKQANSLVNKQSGMCGISGVSPDMRDIEKAAAEGNKRAKMALDMYDYRVLKYVGAYTAAMGGVDIIVFTGGVGENDRIHRKEVASKLEYMGVDFDYEVNDKASGSDAVLTKPDSKVKVLVIQTNEELIIAEDTYKIITLGLDCI